MADEATTVPFIDGSGNSRRQLSAANGLGDVSPQTLLRVNEDFVSLTNPLPVQALSPPNAVALITTTSLQPNLVVSTNPCSILFINVVGADASGWALIFDAVAPPGDGSVEPVAAFQIYEGVGGYTVFPAAPAQMSAGCVICLSSGDTPYTKVTGPNGMIWVQKF